jgi:endo-1,3(4)-beta-glucanase
MKKLIPLLLITLFSSLSYSQWNYGTPFSTSAEQSTWQHVVNPIPNDSPMLDSITAPYPTNAWFNLFYLYGTPFPYTPLPQGDLGQNSSFVDPYQIRFGYKYIGYPNQRALLGVNYKPFFIDSAAGSADYPKVLFGDGGSIFLGTPDPTNFKPALLNDYTEISANIKFFNTTNTNQYYYAPLVRGMAYTTMIYNGVTPAIFFPSPALWKVNDAIIVAGQSFTGTSFKVQTVLQGGTLDPARSSTWMIYSSQPITLTFNQATGMLAASSPLTGWVRVASLTYQGDPKASDTTARKTMLDAYAKFVPIKGNVQVNVANSSATTATMSFVFTRYNEAGLAGNDSLLMMAQPHHVDMLPAGSTTQVLNYKTMKGTMSEVTKKTWVMTEQLPQYSWNPQQGTLTNVPLNWCDSIKRYALLDTVYFYPQYQWNDVYAAGKTLAKQGRIITICDELYDRDNVRYASMQTTAANYRTLLANNLAAWLNGRRTVNVNAPPSEYDSLMYDTRYRGIISSKSYNNLDQDFGSARYNDHHFHYGYYLYAAAVIARKNPGFLTANSNYYLNRITDLARDIANPSRTDQYFALQRYKDWFDGNSWANGLVPYGGGKNQESSSEAANAWYGLYLLGLATGNDNMKYQGAVMLQQEVRAAQKYYHINNANPSYYVTYTNKFRTVTNLYQGLIDASTFFGQVNYYSNGIQIVPITPVTEKLWGNISFCQTMYDFSPNGWKFTQCFNPANTDRIAKQWATIGIGVQAMAYPDAALSFWPNYAYDNNNFDNGQSEANALHWIVTRKFNTLGINVQTISSEVPQGFSLKQNYPNPFNPVTKIVFALPKSGNLTLKIYNSIGSEVSTLVNGKQNAGTYSVDFDASALPSGVYFYKLTGEGFSETKKMMLVK